MPGTLVRRSGPVVDLAALHDALGCAAMAVVQAVRGDEDSASLSLIEAHAAAEEAFGSGSAEVDALNAVFAAITEAAHSNDQTADRGARTPRPASDLSRLRQERTMTHTTADSPPAARSLHEVCEAARRVNCGECWQVPGKPCTSDPDGDHVARFGRAMRRGLITGADLIAVLQALEAFTAATVVYDVPDGAR
jgi:hypothetical protein